MSDTQIFDPVKFSLEENQFLYDQVGQPPVVVKGQVPAGVNPRAVMPVIERAYELGQLETHQGQSWCGVESIRNGIMTYLTEAQKWSSDKRRGAPRFPSLAEYDARGKAHRGAVGSDAGQVKSYFGPDGKRKVFEVEFVPNETPFWVAPTVAAISDTNGILNDSEKARIECLICNHTEKYKMESRSSYNAARARMSKHLRSAKDETDRHRLAYTLEFGA